MTIKVLPKEPVSADVQVDVGNIELLKPATSAAIYTVDAPDATELSLLLPNHTRAFEVRLRRPAILRLSYAAGGTDDGQPHSELQPGVAYERSLIDLTGVTIYFSARGAFPNVIEITVFV